MKKIYKRIGAFILSLLLVWQSIPMITIADEEEKEEVKECSIPKTIICGDESWNTITGDGFQLTLADFGVTPAPTTNDSTNTNTTNDSTNTNTTNDSTNTNTTNDTTNTNTTNDSTNTNTTNDTTDTNTTNDSTNTNTTNDTTNTNTTNDTTDTNTTNDTTNTNTTNDTTDTNTTNDTTDTQTLNPPAPDPDPNPDPNPNPDPDPKPDPEKEGETQYFIKVNRVGGEEGTAVPFDESYRLKIDKANMGKYEVKLLAGEEVKGEIQFEVKYADWFGEDIFKSYYYSYNKTENVITSWGELTLIGTEDPEKIWSFSDSLDGPWTGKDGKISESKEYFVKNPDGLIAKVNITIVEKNTGELPFKMSSLTKKENCTFRRQEGDRVTKILVSRKEEDDELPKIYNFYRMINGKLELCDSISKKTNADGVIYEVAWPKIEGDIKEFDIGICGEYKGDKIFYDKGIKAIFDGDAPDITVYDANDVKIEGDDIESSLQMKIKVKVSDLDFLKDDIEITLTKFDNDGEVLKELEWQPETEGASEIQTEIELLEIGTYTLEIHATDLAGRESTRTINAVVKPEITIEKVTKSNVDDNWYYYNAFPVKYEIHVKGEGFEAKRFKLKENDREYNWDNLRWTSNATEDEGASEWTCSRAVESDFGNTKAEEKYIISASYGENGESEKIDFVVDNIPPRVEYKYTYMCELQDAEGEIGKDIKYLKRKLPNSDTTITYAYFHTSNLHFFTNYPELLITVTDKYLDIASLEVYVQEEGVAEKGTKLDINSDKWKKKEDKYELELHLAYYQDKIPADKAFRIIIVAKDRAKNELGKDDQILAGASDRIYVMAQSGTARMVLDNGNVYKNTDRSIERPNSDDIGSAEKIFFIVNKSHDSCTFLMRKQETTSPNYKIEKDYAGVCKCGDTEIAMYKLEEDGYFQEMIGTGNHDENQTYEESFFFYLLRNEKAPDYYFMIPEKEGNAAVIVPDNGKWVSNKLIDFILYATDAVAEKVDFYIKTEDEELETITVSSNNHVFTWEGHIPKDGIICKINDVYSYVASEYGKDVPPQHIGVEIDPDKPMLTLLYGKDCMYEYGQTFIESTDRDMLYANKDVTLTLVVDGKREMLPNNVIVIDKYQYKEDGETKETEKELFSGSPSLDEIMDFCTIKIPCTLVGEGKHTLYITTDMGSEDLLCNLAMEDGAYRSQTIIIDKTAPQVKVEYPELNKHTTNGVESWYYGGEDAFDAKFTFKDENIDKNRISINVLEGENEYFNFKRVDRTVSGGHQVELTFEGEDGQALEGEFSIVISCIDKVNHVAKYVEYFGGNSPEGGKELETYKSKKIVIDRQVPKFECIYDYTPSNVVDELPYCSREQTVKFKIEEKNCALMEKNANGSLTGLDYKIIPVNYPEEEPVVKVSLGMVNEKGDVVEATGDMPKPQDNVYYVIFTFPGDAKYTVDHVRYEDLAGKVAENTYKAEFVVDRTAPVIVTKELNYGASVKQVVLDQENEKQRLYYQNPFTLKLVAQDVTSGVTHFTIITPKVKPKDADITVDAHVIDAEKGTYEATVTIPPYVTEDGTLDLKDVLCVQVSNNASWTSGEIELNEIVVDNQPPKVRVTYDTDPERRTVDSKTDTWYYNSTLNVPISVTESNFDIGSFELKINDELQKAAQNQDNWEESGGRWEYRGVNLSSSGRYEIEVVECKDHSGNSMDQNTADRHRTVIIDLQKPVINISGGADPTNTASGVKYFNHDVTYTVSVTEENLRPETFEFSLTATDLEGRAISVPDYAAILKEMNGNSANLTFSSDGIYTFSVKCKDWAGWESELVTSERFVVDKSQPSIPTVNYSSPVHQAVLNGANFEYYNEPVTVTITSEDSVSGVQGFEYRFVSAGGVSAINRSIGPVYVSAGEISYSNSGRTASYSFKLPGNVIDANGQLNGTLEVKAINRALWESLNSDARRLVVDNVAPKITVDYNQHVNEVNGILYFNGKIDSTIIIDEANFSSSEVATGIAINGGQVKPLEVAWSDRSVDRHVGTYSLKEDGRYEVSVGYTDRSSNKMPDYRSKVMVIDTIDPEIHISGVKHNSANTDKTIGFTITITDENLDVDKAQISFTAEYLDGSGKKSTENVISKGAKVVSKDGKTVTYVVENIDKDAIYSIECKAVDYAGNALEGMYDDGGNHRNKFTFSVNRDGSTYSLDEKTSAIVGSYVSRPQDITFIEINPNKLKNIKVTMFKNDQTITLQKDVDYVVTEENSTGGWYRYVYVLSEKLFEDDATYRILAYSEDEAGNSSNNALDKKHAEISFVVDATGPEIIVMNLEDKVTYPVRRYTVLFQAEDNMKLSKGLVYLDGKEIARWDEKTIEALITNGREFSFDITDESTKAHELKIVMTDAAGNESVKEIKGFYVTTNLWIRFLNNKALVVGSVVGVLALIVIMLVLAKSNKKKRRVS